MEASCRLYPFHYIDAMNYRAVQLQGKGGLDQLKVIELPLEPPKAGQLRIKVRAAGAGFTDITMRTSKYMFAPPWPFVGGYEVLGEVDAIGDGVTGFRVGQRVCALTVYGAWSEYFTREAEHFVPVPDGVDDGEAVALILNYITAYQMMHRSANIQPGQLALVSGANGGVGTALLELCQLEGVRVIAASSPKHFDHVRQFGAEPIESRTRPLDVLVREKFPDGVDVASTASAAAPPASTSGRRKRAAPWWATASCRRAPASWRRCAPSRRCSSAPASPAAAAPSTASPPSIAKTSSRSKKICPS